jgi:uncharacterized protein (TIGR03435 family)
VSKQAIAYRDGDTELTGEFTWDAERGDKRPGILVVHGGAGLDAHAKGRAKGLAELGFVALACDIYGNGVAGNRERVMARIAELRDDTDKLCQRARAGMDVLLSHPQVDGRVAAVGYCFGGMVALELARSGAEITGAVSVHGSLSTPRPAQSGVVKAKILVCHGALDPHVPMTQVNAFVQEMNEAGADWQLIVYGGAMHGFTHETGPAVLGVAYHALADARSATAIQNFFSEFDRIAGAPAWLESEKYDVEAKEYSSGPDDPRKLSLDQRVSEQKLMLQALLSDRIKLALHRETRDLTVYALVIAKNGPKLRESKPGDSYAIHFDGQRLIAQGIPIGPMLFHLSRQLHRTILDETALSGTYDFTLKLPDGVPLGIDNRSRPNPMRPRSLPQWTSN